MTDWITPLTVLAGGAVAGAALTLTARRSRRSAEPSVAPERKAELDGIIEQLRELRGDENRYPMELRAARLWRKIDREQMAPATPSRSPWRNALRGFAWGLGMVAAVVLLSVFVQRNSQSRTGADQNPPDFLSAMNTDAAQAEVMLKEALAANPNRLDALVHLAVLYAQTGRPNEALAAYEDAVRRHPTEAESLAPLRAEIENLQRPDLAGVIEIASHQKYSPGQILYVIARPEGGGPPVAVSRIQVSTFPLPFTLGAENSMTGQALPEKVFLEARLDSDGDAVTKSENDPAGFVDRVPLGSLDLRIILR